MKFPLLVRAAAIAGVTLLLLMAIAMIRGKVHERQAVAEGVVQSYAAETSGAQVVAGPFLALTCEENYIEERVIKRGGKEETITEPRTGPCPTEYFAPRTFIAAADVPVESLHRGLYSIRTFRATARWRGEVEWPASAESTPTRKRKWKQAYLVTAVRDARGVKTIASSIEGGLLDGVGEPGIDTFAIRQALGAYESRAHGSVVAFDYRATIAGLGSFQVAPVGDTNEIRLTSNWPHPSFSQGWSPDERQVGPGGFSAVWRVNSVATRGKSAWKRIAQKGLANAERAGVAMYDPVNTYTLTYRATEYAFLFILFTFASFAAAEVLSGIRLHPVQYGLVGCALAVFFLLLLALSEHILFSTAYAGAAVACSSLIAFYLRQALRSLARTAAYFTGFLSMYGTLYVMLQSEDNALLIGSLLVFALLAAIMVATRRVSWAAWTPSRIS
jgi:inner membrane protein